MLSNQKLILTLLISLTVVLSPVFAAVNKEPITKTLKVAEVDGFDLGMPVEENFKPEVLFIQNTSANTADKKKYKNRIRQAQVLKINEIDSYFSSVEIKLPSLINLEKFKKDRQTLESYTMPGGKEYFNLAVKTDLVLEKDKLIYRESSWDYGSEPKAYEKAIKKLPHGFVAELLVKPHSEGLLVDKIHIYEENKSKEDSAYDLTIKLEEPILVNTSGAL